MRLIFHKDFVKASAKLNSKLQNKVDETLEIFKINPTERILENHPLNGKMLGKRAIKVTGDVRIVFEQVDGYIVVCLLDVGTHNQVY